MRIEVTVKDEKGRILGDWYAQYAAPSDLLSLSITTDIKNSFVTDSRSNTYHRIPDPPSRKLRILFEDADECLEAGNSAPILNTIEAIIQWIEQQEQGEDRLIDFLSGETRR